MDWKRYIPRGLRILYGKYKARRNSNIIRNVNQAAYREKALVSYITHPFRRETKTHANQLEVKAIVQALDELKYTVDVINFDSKKRVDYEEYSLIVGFGDPFVASFSCKKDIMRVCYTTGTYVGFQNRASLLRSKYAKEVYGEYLLDSLRLVDQMWSVQTTLSDGLITLGDGFAADTFRGVFDGPIFSAPGISYVRQVRIEKQDGELAAGQKHFLWFGSRGLLHKGLDLLLVYFSSHPEFELHICGDFSSEAGFCRLFQKELYETDNIHTYGFVAADSVDYEKIVRNCTFAIMASCSEGCATGVVNVMLNGGLIPVVSKETGIGVGNYGIPINGFTVADIDDAIVSSQRLSPRELVEQYKGIRECTAKNNTYDAFRDRIKNSLTAVLQRK